MYPKFATDQLIQRVIKLTVVTNGDDFLASEVADALTMQNEWLELDSDAVRKISLNRLKLNEQRTSPINMSETVANPSFATLLFIPKNASVLFDYSSSEYSLRWGFTAHDSLTKKSKNISGNWRVTKTECRNIRFQNVFGGTGALHSYPNSQVESFCTKNSSTNFDKVREDVITEMAKEINESIIISAITENN